MTSASALEYRSRYELVEEARSLGVERPERMTMQELRDEILRLSLSEEEQVGARGLFGVARAMLASVVEAGLKMPDAAKVIRGDVNLDLPVRSRSPVATVTLAEIYAAQGHRARALSVLDEVLAIEPDHEEARRIQRDLLVGDAGSPVASGRSAPSLEASGNQQAAGSDATGSAAGSSPLGSSVDGPVAAGPVAAGPVAAGPAAAGPAAAADLGPIRSEFPSTEYVPIEVVETTGHEVGLTPRPVDVAPMTAVPAPAAPEGEDPLAVERVVQPDSVAPVGAVPEGTAAPEEGVADDGAWASDPLLATEKRGATLLLYWELPPYVVARSGLTESEGGAAVVVVAFTPSGPTPHRDQRTFHLSWQRPFAGTLVVPDLAPQAAVRAAVGWMVEGTFLPLAVGRPIERLLIDAPEAATRAEAALEQIGA